MFIRADKPKKCMFFKATKTIKNGDVIKSPHALWVLSAVWMYELKEKYTNPANPVWNFWKYWGMEIRAGGSPHYWDPGTPYSGTASTRGLASPSSIQRGQSHETVGSPSQVLWCELLPAVLSQTLRIVVGVTDHKLAGALLKPQNYLPLVFWKKKNWVRFCFGLWILNVKGPARNHHILIPEVVPITTVWQWS